MKKVVINLFTAMLFKKLVHTETEKWQFLFSCLSNVKLKLLLFSVLTHLYLTYLCTIVTSSLWILIKIIFSFHFHPGLINQPAILKRLNEPFFSSLNSQKCIFHASCSLNFLSYCFTESLVSFVQSLWSLQICTQLSTAIKIRLKWFNF